MYVRHGPTAASKATGIDKGYITRLAKRAGLATVAIARTRLATEAMQERAALRRMELGGQLLDAIGAVLERMDEPYVEVHRGGRELTYQRPPGRAQLDFAKTVAALVDTYERIDPEHI